MSPALKLLPFQTLQAALFPLYPEATFQLPLTALHCVVSHKQTRERGCRTSILASHQHSVSSSCAGTGATEAATAEDPGAGAAAFGAVTLVILTSWARCQKLWPNCSRGKTTEVRNRHEPGHSILAMLDRTSSAATRRRTRQSQGHALLGP